MYTFTLQCLTSYEVLVTYMTIYVYMSYMLYLSYTPIFMLIRVYICYTYTCYISQMYRGILHGIHDMHTWCASLIHGSHAFWLLLGCTHGLHRRHMLSQGNVSYNFEVHVTCIHFTSKDTEHKLIRQMFVTILWGTPLISHTQCWYPTCRSGSHSYFSSGVLAFPAVNTHKSAQWYN
jgi:hypothetical protein